jgi:hypothetical protein
MSETFWMSVVGGVISVNDILPDAGIVDGAVLFWVGGTDAGAATLVGEPVSTEVLAGATAVADETAVSGVELLFCA